MIKCDSEKLLQHDLSVYNVNGPVSSHRIAGRLLQFQVLAALKVRYQDKAVVVGVVITAVLGASAGQLHYTVGEIAQIGERF